MVRKPTYEELQQRIAEFEEESAKRKWAEKIMELEENRSQ